MSFLLPRQPSHRGKAIKSTAQPVSFIDSPDASRGHINQDSSSVINFYPKWCQCIPTTEGQHIEDAPWVKRCGAIFRCPPHGVLSRLIYFTFLNGVFWAFIWGLDCYLAQDAIAALITLEVLGLVSGVCLKQIGLPALLAPLILGIILNNIPSLNFFYGLHHRQWIEPIREIALCIILTRAGIELNPKKLKALKAIVPLAAFGPCLVEAMTCAGLMYGFFGTGNGPMPIAMCFVAGFALAAVSPAVVVPGMLSLQRKRYGIASGIPTLLIAASSIDDVLAISAFSVCLNLVKPTVGTDQWKVYAGACGIIVGIFHGLLVGMILHFIPSDDMGKLVPYFRVTLLLMCNMASVLIYRAEQLKWLSGAGTLGALLTAFVASFGWRSVRHHTVPMKKVETVLAHIWTLIVPLLFGTIGNEICVKNFQWKVVGTLCGVIFISLIIRCLTMFVIVCAVHTTFKERIFSGIAWMPKATVQAALAPLVVSQLEGTKFYQNAENIVLLAVLGILLTAPAGAVCITVLGPRLLTRSEEEEVVEEEEDDVMEVRIDKLDSMTSQPELSGLAPDNESADGHAAPARSRN